MKLKTLLISAIVVASSIAVGSGLNASAAVARLPYDATVEPKVLTISGAPTNITEAVIRQKLTEGISPVAAAFLDLDQIQIAIDNGTVTVNISNDVVRTGFNGGNNDGVIRAEIARFNNNERVRVQITYNKKADGEFDLDNPDVSFINQAEFRRRKDVEEPRRDEITAEIEAIDEKTETTAEDVATVESLIAEQPNSHYVAYWNALLESVKNKVPAPADNTDNTDQTQPQTTLVGNAGSQSTPAEEVKPESNTAAISAPNTGFVQNSLNIVAVVTVFTALIGATYYSIKK